MFRKILLSMVAAGAFGVAPSVAGAATVSVPATGTSPNYFTDSGVNIPAGESVTVSATGAWSTCPGCTTTGPDGVGGFPPFFWWSDPAASSNTLIGSVDSAGTWTAVGAGPTVVNGPGELLLATNDISPSVNDCGFSPSTQGCYADNSGTVSATIAFNNVPTSAVQCKKGGWQSLNDADGTKFKNQGDCVSYVATAGKNPASGS
jgi:hypothetical protein